MNQYSVSYSMKSGNCFTMRTESDLDLDEYGKFVGKQILEKPVVTSGKTKGIYIFSSQIEAYEVTKA